MLVRFEYPRAVEQSLEDLFDFQTVADGQSVPPMDIAEYEDRSEIVVELPGVRKEDLSLTIEKDWLTISGGRKADEIPPEATVVLNERKMRSFNRSVRLHHPVKADSVTAELQNGILRIVLPKAEEARVKTVQIK